MHGRAISCLILGFLQILGSAGREIPGWEVGVDRRTSAYIDPVRDTTIISGREICEDPDLKIVIVVESTPDDSSYRTAIRETWADHQNVSVGFLIGVSTDSSNQDDLKNESSTFRDIIQDSFVESYFNLTLKGISILKWFTRTCPKAQFLVKADHDTYIDVPRLIQRLARYQNASGVLRGNLCSEFDRDDWIESKYYAPEYMYPGRKYPNFLQGSAYYMTRDVAEKLFETAMKTPIFHLEDVYITGICAKISGVKPEKDYGVRYLFGSPVTVCLSNYTITCNSVQPHEMKWLLYQFRGMSFNKEEPFKYLWPEPPEKPFIYVTEKDTTLIENTKKPATLRSADIISSSASSMKKALFMPASVIHALLQSCVQIVLP